MKTIFVIGFEWKDFVDFDNARFIYYTSERPELLSAKEVLLFIRKAIHASDVVVVNGCKNLDIDEVFALQIAYSKNTPILMVGKQNNAFLQEVVTNTFNTLQDMKDHLKVYYIDTVF